MALAAAVCASGCVAPRYQPAPPNDGITNVLEWTLGATSRVPNPASMDAYLILLPAGKPLEQATRVTSGCFGATSFLPGPAGDARIFFSIQGRLHVRRASGDNPVQLDGADPALRVRRLLAFVAATSPLEVLVEAQPVGASSGQAWLFTVGERALLSVKRLKDDPSFEDAAVFFRKFRAPRCLDGGHRCLVLSTDERKFYLDIEPERGKRPEPLQGLGSADARDAAWASADGTSLYLLMSCGPRVP